MRLWIYLDLIILISDCLLQILINKIGVAQHKNLFETIIPAVHIILLYSAQMQEVIYYEFLISLKQLRQLCMSAYIGS